MMLLNELAGAIDAVGGRTRIVPWHIGDGLVPIAPGEFTRRPLAAG